MSDVFSLPSHPVAAVFPLMGEAELGALAADIKTNGLKFPIVLDHRGKSIVDGRNRRDACQLVDVTPETRCLDENPINYILAVNVRRRHLDESQRGMVAARIANLERGARPANASIDALAGGWISHGDASGLLNISRATVQRTKVVLERGAPELVEAVDSGKIKLNEAQRLTKLPQEQQRRIVALLKAERKAARPASLKRTQIASAPSAPPEGSVVPLDPVATLMAAVRKLVPADLARFKEPLVLYCAETITPPPTRPEPSALMAAPPVCQSPKGECRYRNCATSGRCLAQPAAA